MHVLPAGQSRHEIAGGVVFFVADDHRPAAVRLHRRSFGDRFNRVVRSFAMGVRLQELQQTIDRRRTLISIT